MYPNWACFKEWWDALSNSSLLDPPQFCPEVELLCGTYEHDVKTERMHRQIFSEAMSRAREMQVNIQWHV